MARYQVGALRHFATQACAAAGLEPEKARAVAEVLLEGDLMGHDTHGLALLTPYLDALLSGDMRGSGEPEVVSATAVAQTWDGRKLPGPWLVRRAIGEAEAASASLGIGVVSIGRCHHIGCLAAYGPPVAAAGRMLLLTCSDPATGSVAPWGGTRRLYTPNPLAAAWPTPAGPVLIDVSMSVTTNGMTGRKRAEGQLFDHEVLLDAQGTPTRDPNAFWADGTLMPLGGVEAGHKGFALGLLIEVLTSALAGHGRADAPTGWGASVLVMVIDPARFGGTAAFLRETGWMADAVHANPPKPGGEAPRLPGERAMARRAQAMAEGVALHPAIPPALARLAQRFELELPAAG
ncbi:Ldh family oxidoreductase [Falsiroseomonas selenitidurans]|uniref:Ldh family oxidoreductase n=1 Tax=Falsiroseomonas selenitidurans TaxID=2716335 RepID=A0ABX1DZA1_9PROT|nr:Ldh family oxidoreductase [Falsiroseomonas selenitidurans]NKC29700.1 Ldh family oxidoreductase [Falsiroseomonas selenitidurans]